MADSDFAPALKDSILGLARVDRALNVLSRLGGLMDWLPVEGEKITDCPVFFAMEEQFASLRAGELPRIDLPGLRLAPDRTPLSVSVLDVPEADEFVVFAAADVGALDAERQLARERRQTRLLEEQSLAAGRLIREQAALYRDIVDTSSDLVFRLGPDLRVTFVNAVACRLLGEEESEIIGRGIESILGSTPDDRWTPRLTQGGEASFEQAVNGPDGGTLWIWWSVHWVGEINGPGEFQALGRDISDLRRLRAEAARGAEEARLSAVMRERLRIAHDLHDTLVQSLVALVPQMRLIRKIAAAGDWARATEEIDHAEKAARSGLDRARDALTDLRRQNVQPEGLAAALENLGRRFTERTGINVLVDIDQRARAVGQETAEVFYRIAEEALRNAELHAQPNRVGIYLAADETDAVTLVVADDGRGFDSTEDATGHYGLIGMREQADMIGARFTLDTDRGGGVRIQVIAPGARAALA